MRKKKAEFIAEKHIRDLDYVLICYAHPEGTTTARLCHTFKLLVGLVEHIMDDVYYLINLAQITSSLQGREVSQLMVGENATPLYIQVDSPQPSRWRLAMIIEALRSMKAGEPVETKDKTPLCCAFWPTASPSLSDSIHHHSNQNNPASPASLGIIPKPYGDSTMSFFICRRI